MDFLKLSDLRSEKNLNSTETLVREDVFLPIFKRIEVFVVSCGSVPALEPGAVSLPFSSSCASVKSN